MNAVETKGLEKIFTDFWRRPLVRAVDDITFSVPQGEVVGLLGPNGSGKSTTIKMLLGLLYPSAGQVRIFGQAPGSRAAKSRIGYLPEESYLYPYLTARETIHFFSRLFDLPSDWAKKNTDDLLALVGLSEAMDRRVGDFSKGMARRIGLAQALISDPDLLILDEPTAGLDPLGMRQIKDLILDLSHRGKTILISSHLLSEMEEICDRVAILYRGKIRAMGTIRELLTDTRQCQVVFPETSPELLGRILAELKKMLGSAPETSHPERRLEEFFIDVIKRVEQERSD